MSTQESGIKQGLRRVTYLRKERAMIVFGSLAAMLGTFFLLDPSLEEPRARQFIGVVVAIVGLAIIFNTVRFALVKCPRCRRSFNGYAYLVGIRRGSALECIHCGLSLSVLPEFKPRHKPGGQEQW